MSAGYVVARENFKEAGKHVSAESDPVMFNLLYGLQSLTNQIEADFAALLGRWNPELTRVADQETQHKKAWEKVIRFERAT